MTKKKLTKKQEQENLLFELINKTIDDETISGKWNLSGAGDYTLSVYSNYIVIKRDSISILKRNSGNRIKVTHIEQTKENEKKFNEIVNKIDSIFYEKGIYILNEIFREMGE